MQVAVVFSDINETQKMMRFLQHYYGAISDMEKYSIDTEKKITFLSGEPSGMLRNVREQVVMSRWEVSMPLQALYLYCWMAVKSSYRNENDAPVVYVMDQEFEIVFNYQSTNDTKKILVNHLGFPEDNGDDSIISYFTGGSKGFFNLINRKLQERHTNHIKEIMIALDHAYVNNAY